MGGSHKYEYDSTDTAAIGTNYFKSNTATWSNGLLSSLSYFYRVGCREESCYNPDDRLRQRKTGVIRYKSDIDDSSVGETNQTLAPKLVSTFIASTLASPP